MDTITESAKTIKDEEYVEYNVIDNKTAPVMFDVFIECFDVATMQKYVLDSTIRVTWVYCTKKTIGKQMIELYDVPPFGLFHFNNSVWQKISQADKLTYKDNN